MVGMKKKGGKPVPNCVPKKVKQMPNPSYEIKGGKAKGGPQGVPNTNPARVVPKGSLRPGSIDVPFKRLAYAMKKGFKA